MLLQVLPVTVSIHVVALDIGGTRIASLLTLNINDTIDAKTMQLAIADSFEINAEPDFSSFSGVEYRT